MTALTPEREAQLIDEAAVDAVAEAIYRTACKYRAAYITWATLPPHLRAMYLEEARAAWKVVRERDAHARDLALLAEVRGHAGTPEVLEAFSGDLTTLPPKSDASDALELLVRLLRGEGP
jgi:hypothetical protein